MVTMLGPELGGVGAVVNWLSRLVVRAFPLKSVIPGHETTVIVEDGGKTVVNVAVRLSAEIDGKTSIQVLPLYKPNVRTEIVAGFTECENTTDTTAFWPTPVAPFAGVTEVIVRGVATGDVTGV
jgi:hypothetical protein